MKLIKKDPENKISYIKAFTAAYQRCGDPILREVKCLQQMIPYVFLPPEEEDLFVGRLYYPELGLSPEPLGGRGVCYNYDANRFREIESALSGDALTEIRLIREFWEKENTRRKIRQAFPPHIAKALPYDDEYYQESHVAFPLYRTVGIYLDYDKLLSLGISGMKDLVMKRKTLAEKQQDRKASRLMEAMELALNLFNDLCAAYAETIAEMLKTALPERRIFLKDMEASLRRIAAQKPACFRDAAQLSFLYTLISGSLNYGRIDVYLGDFYVNDLQSGRITEVEALSYLKSLWRLIAARKTVFHGRVIIGGMGRRNEANADKLALLAIDASRAVKEIEPQLSLRFYEGQNPELMEKALCAIGEGRTYPILYNDDVNVPSVEKAFSVSRADAEDYLPFGCGEYVLNHKSFGSPNGIINMLKALEVTMHNGYDPLSKQNMGLKLGDFSSFPTFDAFYTAYKQQLTFFIEILAQQEVIEYEVVAAQAPFLFLSMLYDDCIDNGRAAFDGGIRYLGGTLETYGNVNTANSLCAIKKLVFEEHAIDPDTLMKALDNDFTGYGTVRRQLLEAPKYGNDDDIADEMAVDLHEFTCTLTRNQRKKVPLHTYLVVIINNEANTLVGRFTAASADGRKSGEYLANANAPAGGTDKNGITAVFNSTVKLRTDIHAGAVQNMKFSKCLFNDRRALAASLLKTYFSLGGAHAMITVLSKGDLEDAVMHPEKHRNLMVRVGGFSARFVELNPDVQREIMSRTLY